MIKNRVSFFVDYFFHTAIASSLLYINTQFIRGFKIDYTYVAFLFFATLGVYNYSNLNTLNKNNRKALITLSTVLTFAYCLKNVDYIFELKWKLLFITILVCGYIFPLKKLHLRNIGILKIFILSTVWSMATVLTNDLQNRVTLITFVQNFFFVFSISLPFDMRDIEVDKIKTVPKSIGKLKTVLLSILAYVIAMCFTYSLTQSLPIFMMMLLVGVPYIWLAFRLYWHKYYLAGLELLIVLNTLLFIYFFDIKLQI